MADRSSNIQVPALTDGELPATAAQLQTIRQMVTGMSLRGFRFDYRKLGTHQASAVIDQLIRLRDAQPVAVAPKSGGGCVASFARGVTRLVVFIGVLACIAGGGYLIYQKVNEPAPPDGGQASTDPDTMSDGSNRTDAQANTGSRNGPRFFGVPLDGSTPDDTTTNEQDTPTRGQLDPTPPEQTTDPPVRPTPRLNVAQLEEVERILVSLSQHTRQTYDTTNRNKFADRTDTRLAEISGLMAALEQTSPGLAERIRRVVAGYRAALIDPPAIREEIKAIRDALSSVRERL